MVSFTFMFMLNVDSVADDVRTEDCSGFYCRRNTKRSVADYSEIKNVFFFTYLPKWCT